MTNEAGTIQSESAASNTSAPDTKSSRRARNDNRWDSLKEEIFDVYMKQDRTLQDMKQVIEARHGYIASVRKWKEKLKEWNFEKNISASDMTIVLSKAEKRLREEGKETAIFHGGSQISKERIEQFKRRKIFREEMAISPCADTPQNITYTTPPPESPKHISSQTTQTFSPISDSNTLCQADASSSSDLAAPKPYPKSVLSKLFEGVEEGIASEETLGNSNNEYSRCSPHHELLSDSAGVILMPDNLPSEQDSSASLDGCVTTDFSCQSEPRATLEINSKISFSDTEHIDQQLHQLSLGFGSHSEMDSLIRPMTQISEHNSPINKLNKSIQSQYLEPELGSLASRSVYSDKRVSSLEPTESELARSSTDPDSSSGSSASTTSVASEATIKTALELDSQGWSNLEIFQFFAGPEPLPQRKFCEGLRQLALLFEANLHMKEALMAYNLIQAGQEKVPHPWVQNEIIKCLMSKARILRKMKRHVSSGALAREAIAVFQDLGDEESELEGLLVLANCLSHLNMDSEALYLVLDAFIRKTWYIYNTHENQKLVKLLDFVQRIYSKIDNNGDSASVAARISRMINILECWRCTQDSDTLWFEIAMLGSRYSSRHEFDLAGLCFSSLAPLDLANDTITNPNTCFMMAQYHKELCLHYNRQTKGFEATQQLAAAFQQLTFAFQHFASLLPIGQEEFGMIEKKAMDSLLAILEQLLKDNSIILGKESSRSFMECEYACERAQEARDKLAMPRSQSSQVRPEIAFPPRRDSLRNFFPADLLGSLRSKSISSNGSSLGSRGSAASRFGLTYSVGSASSLVSNSVFMVP